MDTYSPRSTEEIIARIKEIQSRKDDLFGVRSYRLLFALPEEDMIQHWKICFSEKPEDYKREKPLEQISSYIEFAYSKAGDGRGLSASRSLEHFTELLWLLGDDFTDKYEEFVDAKENEYSPYGWPLLYRIDRWFNLNTPPICTAIESDGGQCYCSAGDPDKRSVCATEGCPCIICDHCTNDGIRYCEGCSK